MSHSLPHLTLTTSTSSLSPTSPLFPTISPTHTRPLVLGPYLPCEVPRQSGGSTQIPSLTFSARVQSNNNNNNNVDRCGLGHVHAPLSPTGTEDGRAAEWRFHCAVLGSRRPCERQRQVPAVPDANCAENRRLSAGAVFGQGP